MIVGAEGPWTPTELASRLEMPLTTVLFRVGRLEKRGHVERIPNPDDRRSYLLELTHRGELMARTADPALAEAYASLASLCATRLSHGLVAQHPATAAARAALS